MNYDKNKLTIFIVSSLLSLVSLWFGFRGYNRAFAMKENSSIKNGYKLPKLPYSFNSLEPYIDAKTMKIHYTKHHQAYADNLNRTLKNYPEFSSKPVEELLKNIDALPKEIQESVKNYGGGFLNHSIFWPMMSPMGGGEPKGKIKEEIIKTFGSIKNFKEEFNKLARKIFGSGYAWLCADQNGKLVLMQTKDQDSPVSIGFQPILCLDVWEHAYYLKYQNRRSDYINNWWNVVNWQHIEDNYNKIKN